VCTETLPNDQGTRFACHAVHRVSAQQSLERQNLLLVVHEVYVWDEKSMAMASPAALAEGRKHQAKEQAALALTKSRR